MSVYSLKGKGLRLDTREDVEPYLRDIDPEQLEEIHLGGNTIGVEAALALASVLQKASKLKVRNLFVTLCMYIDRQNVGGRFRRYLHGTVDQRNTSSYIRFVRRTD
jgi:Ran GTPase-activating protein (RanGAP) involved in mRNA processing and transport